MHTISCKTGRQIKMTITLDIVKSSFYLFLINSGTCYSVIVLAGPSLEKDPTQLGQACYQKKLLLMACDM